MFSRPKPAKNPIKQLSLQNIVSANPVTDLRAAIKQGDYRFVGILGYALDVPDVRNFHEKYEKEYGYKVIEGTSDVIKYPKLQSIAFKYAEKYNQQLLKEIKDK